MTTHTTSTRIRHDSDANFREWGSEFSSALSTIGLTQSADTGQINWTTVTRPAMNTDAGYQIWYFNDSLHGTAPLYIKFYFGTHNGTSHPRIRVEVGTGSNGSGTLTNPTAITLTGPSVNQVSDTARTSYWCYANGCFWWVHKIAAGLSADFALTGGIICRSVDANGNISADGIVCILHNQTSGSTSTAPFVVVRHSNTWYPTTTPVTAGLAIAPFPYTSSGTDVNGDVGVIIPVVDINGPRPLLPVLAGFTANFALGNTATLTPIGSTSHTYLWIEQALGAAGYNYQTAASLGFFLIYE